MSCSRSRCSGGPTPAVSSTVTPNGCHVSFVPAGPEIEERGGIGRLALDEDGVAAVGELDRPRRAVAIPGRHARRPALGRTSRWPSLEIRGGSVDTAAHRRVSWPSALGGAIVPLPHVGGHAPTRSGRVRQTVDVRAEETQS